MTRAQRLDAGIAANGALIVAAATAGAPLELVVVLVALVVAAFAVDVARHPGER